MTPRQCVEFFVLVPAIAGLFFGMARVGSVAFDSVWEHVIYTVVHATVAWISWGIGSKVTSLVLRPWQPPLVLVLVAGHFVGGFVVWWPLREFVNQPFEHLLVAGTSFPPFWPPERWDSYAIFTLQGCALWVLANWLDLRFRRVGRFGFSPLSPVPAPAGAAVAGITTPPVVAAELPAAGSPPPVVPAAPRLVQRLPPHLKDAEILVLEAEEHYIKVHTTRGNTLLLLRLTDAMNEMEPQPGLRVHRSYWVSRDAVVRIFRRDRRWLVKLKNGLEIPVSRSYRVIVQHAGLQGGAVLSDD